MKILKNKPSKIIAILCLAVFIIAGICGVYVGDYYHADMGRIEDFTSESGVTIRQDEDGYLVFEPDNASAGFVFYPGGKVEYSAYIPLMDRLAADGILCVLVKMPFNLAVLDMDAAEKIPRQYPVTDRWYIGGHSLGGAMAASCIDKNDGLFAGLVLLGAYSTADLSRTQLAVLSVYGSEDMVMDREKYARNKPNLPEDFTEIILDGGCHAGFGMYGPQDGDGVPAISSGEQIVYTADAITAMIHRAGQKQLF